nr:MAG TPA: hypothetical protein [Crassvirales sp.]
MNTIDTTINTTDTISTIVSQMKGVSYNGRNTKTPKGYKK